MTDDGKLELFINRNKPHRYEECDWLNRHLPDKPHCKCGNGIDDRRLHLEELQRESQEERRVLVRDPQCQFCHGEGSYWEQGPNCWTTCTQCGKWVLESELKTESGK